MKLLDVFPVVHPIEFLVELLLLASETPGGIPSEIPRATSRAISCSTSKGNSVTISVKMYVGISGETSTGFPGITSVELPDETPRDTFVQHFSDKATSRGISGGTT